MLSYWPRAGLETLCVPTSTATAHFGKVVEAYFGANGLDFI